MAIFQDDERRFARAVSRLIDCNPFLPERIDAEREALGAQFVADGSVWSSRVGLEPVRPNVARIDARAEAIAAKARERLAAGKVPVDDERALYDDLVVYVLFQRRSPAFLRIIQQGGSAGHRSVEPWDDFRRDIEGFMAAGGGTTPSGGEAAHLFACLFQVRRAFNEIFTHIIGGSMPAARLRAAVWQSIFTHDMRRYRRAMYARMGDVTTLVTGPTGTGKELVARAIALSRYIPFDPASRSFTEDFAGSFHPLNLSALSPTLIESELFGHRKGAFTGALADRAGWLELCRPLGTVFLDEIGDLAPSIQVKLLRVLQTRTFQRLGDTEDRSFQGKIIAATNRNLAQEIDAGRFREDFYFRICSDIIETPALRTQIADSPEELHHLVRHVAGRIAGDGEADALTAEVEHTIEENLGRDYPWSGNVRELEQCVRNVLIRGEYRPPRVATPDASEELLRALSEGRLTADQIVSRYCTIVYARTRSYVETARRLGLDRRTVKAKVDPQELDRLR